MREKKAGSKKETFLHAGLKAWYAQSGGQMEQLVDGYIIDVMRADELVEVQTGNFSALRAKLADLLETHVVRVVYPVAVARWIVRIDNRGVQVSRRKSPRSACVYTVFDELTSLHGAIAHPNFRLEVALVHEEQIWRDDGFGSWRRKHWSLAERRLLRIVGQEVFDQPSEYLRLLPAGMPDQFTTVDLLQAIRAGAMPGITRRLTGRMARALRILGVIQMVGKRGLAFVYCKPS